MPVDRHGLASLADSLWRSSGDDQRLFDVAEQVGPLCLRDGFQGSLARRLRIHQLAAAFVRSAPPTSFCCWASCVVSTLRKV